MGYRSCWKSVWNHKNLHSLRKRQTLQLTNPTGRLCTEERERHCQPLIFNTILICTLQFLVCSDIMVQSCLG